MRGLTGGARKTTGSDPARAAEVVVYDATLTTSLPASLSAAGGPGA